MNKFSWRTLIHPDWPTKSPTPHLQWHITDRCNLRCQHCYQTSYSGNGLDYPSLLDILDQFRCLVLHFRERYYTKLRGHITLTGGEPFARKSFPALVEKIAEQNSLFSFSVLTNGSMIDQERAEWLGKMRPRYVQVSMDGNHQIHDSIRGEGNFAKTRQTIQLLKKMNIRVMVSFTAHQTNYQTFPEVAQACKEVDADFLWSDRLIPESESNQIESLQINNIVPMSTTETHDFFKIMKSEADKCKNDRSTKTRVKMHRALQFQYSDTTAYRCVAGETFLTIMPNGDLYPCRRMPVKVGNVLETPLATLYYGSPFLRNLRNNHQISQGCQECNKNKECRGGLKCLSYAVYGDAHVKDPNCLFSNTQSASAGSNSTG